ncbi:hypothetical protein POTOM_055014 [Populus tomentosa]|uniref:Uncharacterized protein n=1 Tax=Populus tomentosa TaxID=118781 RepID=A0A8X7Y0A7_POPTO|nr:hypothetical protein POTOM_055014 [Populus tomentosa]
MDGARACKGVISFPEGPILPIQSQEEGFCFVAKAMAKFVAVFLLALIAISMLQTLVVASHGHGGHHKNKNQYGPGSLKSFQINQFKRDNTPLKISICGLWISRSNQNVHHNARGGAARPSTISHACSSVRSAAGSASAFPQGIMGIKLCALATTTGRPRKEGPSALEQ